VTTATTTKKPTPLSVPAQPDEDAIIGKAYDPHIARRLLGYVRPYQKQILIALVWVTVAMAAYIVGPYLIKVALDSGMAARNPDVLAQVVALYLVAGLVQWIGTYLRIRIMAVVGQSIIFDMRRELFDRLQLFLLGFFSRYAVGRLILRVINDVGVLREMITWAVLAVFRDFFDLFGTTVAMLVLSIGDRKLCTAENERTFCQQQQHFLAAHRTSFAPSSRGALLGLDLARDKRRKIGV
jgi:ATP-binding cassette, subfamily B, multidrug efflux pump